MKKTSTIQSARAFLVAALALLCVSSCSKAEDDGQVVNPKEPVGVSATRSYEEARLLAQKSISFVDKGKTRSAGPRSLCGVRGQCVTTPCTRNGESQIDTLMYVFNFENSEGFSVIAANRAVDPVLAVAEMGNYTYGEETGVENFDFYMQTMAQSLIGIKIPQVDTVRTMPNFKTVEVDEVRSCDPLVPINWGQDGIFGAYCSNGLSGCVATAIAQIMSAYRFPASIATTYTDAPHAGETIALDWNSMIGYPYVYQTSALMREIGNRVGMRYPSGSSGANPLNVPDGLRAFGFSCSSGYASCEQFAIFNTLDDERPVYMRGDDVAGGGGHAWVADGYEYSRIGTLYYEEKLVDNDEPGLIPHCEYVLVDSTVRTISLVHYNWGWNGYCNGYFSPIRSCDSGLYEFSGVQMITSIRLN